MDTTRVRRALPPRVPTLFALLALVALGCAGEDGERHQDSDPAFRGYVWESVGIVYLFTGGWSAFAEGRTESVEEEMAALHFAAATAGISLTRWTDERRAAEIVDLMEKTTAALALDGAKTQREWEDYLQRRSPDYEQALPSPRGLGWDVRNLTEADLLRIGAVFVEGLRSRGSAADQALLEEEGVELSVGEHFRSRLDQLMQGIGEMPGYRLLPPSRDTTP